MKGLLKNNFYAVYANAGLFSIIMLLLGIFVIAACNAIPSLLIGYALSVMVGFSINAISGLGKECSSKWAKYKLTVPVKRTDIVKSYYISLLLGSGLTTLQLILTAGILLACALLAFVLSYPLTILIFVKKEY